MSSDLDTVNHVKSNSNESMHDIFVEVCDLSTFFSNGEYPSLIKIDVEGFETEVIAGMQNIISSNKLRIKINVKKIKKVFKIFFAKSNIK